MSASGAGPALRAGERVGRADPTVFRAAAAQFATGVAVLTAHDGREAYAKTVSSFVSLSLEPPLVSVAVNQRSPIIDAVRSGGGFAVNVLSREQRALAERFAVPGQGRGRGVLDVLTLRSGISGAPLLEGALSRFDCLLYQLLPGGDHTILLGLAEQVVTEPGPPLLYHRGRYLTA